MRNINKKIISILSVIHTRCCYKQREGDVHLSIMLYSQILLENHTMSPKADVGLCPYQKRKVTRFRPNHKLI